MDTVDLDALAERDGGAHPLIAAEQEERLARLPLLSASLARKAKAQRERGFIFELKAMGAFAIVRPLKLGDKAVIGALPQFIQTKLLQALADAAEGGKSARTKTGGIDVAQALGNIGRREDLINAVCVAGFVEPRLILSEAQRQSDDEVLVADLDYDDRSRFFDLCNGDEDEVKALEPFLGSTERAAEPVAAG